MVEIGTMRERKSELRTNEFGRHEDFFTIAAPHGTDNERCETGETWDKV